MMGRKYIFLALFLIFFIIGCKENSSYTPLQPHFGAGGWKFGTKDNDEVGFFVHPTQDGGYIVVGSIGPSRYDTDVYLIKIDTNGEKQWAETFSNNDWNVGFCIQPTQDGGYIIVGGTGSSSYNSHVYLIKVDAAGIEQWNKVLGSGKASYVQQTQDGGYIITGKRHQGERYQDVYLIKTDADGNKQWAKTFNNKKWDIGLCIQPTQDGGYIIVGSTGSGYYYYDSLDVYLIKTDADGNKQWAKTFNNRDQDIGVCIQPTQDGGYIIVGSTWSYHKDVDVYLLKIDANGNKQWAKTFGGTKADEGYYIQQAQDGGYIIVGYTRSHGLTRRDEDVYLIKTDTDGNAQWYKIFGYRNEELGYCIQETQDGGYIIVGESRSYHSDIFLIKIDKNGVAE
jgi:hypothetical protein